MLKVVIPENLNKEIDELSLLIEKFKNEEIDKTELKVHRVPFGIYEQRKSNTYMIRVRCTAGIITPLQLELLSRVSQQYGGHAVHITTRQEVQIHDVAIDSLIPAIKSLKYAGLSSRGGGGNTVRNIVASVDSGIDPDEVFDVSPYATALTSRLVSESDSWGLPRKLKLAFSNSPEDTAGATITDLGFIAVIKDGRKGFKVYCAGGMGAKSAQGKLLFDFIPGNDVYLVAEGMKLLFNKFGSRKNRQAARLRFLWEKMGGDEFKKLLQKEIDALEKQYVLPLELSDDQNYKAENQAVVRNSDDHAGFELWKKRYVKCQKQNGYYRVIVPVILGDVSNSALIKLAEFLRDFGEDVIRFSQDQNIHMRNIKGSELLSVYELVKELFPNSENPQLFGNIVSCAGASTCKLGICLSRGAAKAIVQCLFKSGTNLDKAVNLSIRISGCPNSCGQHLTGDIGFYGFAARKGERLYPAYIVTGGAAVLDEKISFGIKLGEISARKLPEFTRALIEDYAGKTGVNHSFKDYLDNGGKDYMQGLLKEKFSEVPDFEDDKNFYFDWDAGEIFSLASRGMGECSAGLFDFIERDLKNIDDSRKALDISSNTANVSKFAYELLYYSARMLLITRGVETDKPEVIFPAFIENFIETGALKTSNINSIKNLLNKASIGDTAGLFADKDIIIQFSDNVIGLYQSMDDSLQFKPAAAMEVKNSRNANLFKDLRGVTCPMNFVKTKMELSKINNGEILEIFLDNGAPIENVPRSVESEGHEILSQEKIGEYWKVVIVKGGK